MQNQSVAFLKGRDSIPLSSSLRARRMGDKFLYIFVITVSDGDFDIDHLRELLSRVEKIRGKAFVLNPQTFVVHSESDLSEILRKAGFSFEKVYDSEIGQEFYL